ncbi:hypothetical protein CUMW_188270 [Citrus unshiu]|uniref:RNase H type-1 domain-containing protein n=1 Tax=Citrus unshiu TaxID=55188 RepID=A0A2H5Q1Y7_CITUN|nr:hypothetical protein CUMW_188270 [Citrus unshiu]
MTQRDFRLVITKSQQKKTYKGFNFFGCPMFVMTRKLKALKIHLREWNEEFSGNVNDKVDQAQNSLEAVQVDISVNGMTMDSFQAEIEAQANLQNTIETAFATKLIAIILAIEHASIRDWTMLWIECDSPLTVHLCNKRLLPPWFLTHRWNNCIALMDSMTTRFAHVFGEGNGLADSLANLGATVDSFTWQDSAPPRCCFCFVEGCSYAA